MIGWCNNISRTESIGSRASKAGPGWRSNVRGDYRSMEIKPITTKDLICWAFQVIFYRHHIMHIMKFLIRLILSINIY